MCIQQDRRSETTAGTGSNKDPRKWARDASVNVASNTTVKCANGSLPRGKPWVRIVLILRHGWGQRPENQAAPTCTMAEANSLPMSLSASCVFSRSCHTNMTEPTRQTRSVLSCQSGISAVSCGTHTSQTPHWDVDRHVRKTRTEDTCVPTNSPRRAAHLLRQHTSDRPRHHPEFSRFYWLVQT